MPYKSLVRISRFVRSFAQHSITHKRPFVMMLMMSALGVSLAFGTFSERQPVQAAVATVIPSVTQVFNPIDYTPIKPSLTDGDVSDADCEDPLPNNAIGCENIWDDNLALNSEHYLSYPEGLEHEGKLLVFLCGGDGKAEFCENVYPAAAQRGYHVIGLTYPGNFRGCGQNFSCYGDLMWENITGEERSNESHLYEHRQDSVVQRLIKVLEWATDQNNNPVGHSGDLGWGRYLTGAPGAHDIDWTQVNLAGFSNGSSHASRMGMLFPSVGRVALFAGPNDGREDSTTGAWKPASYIEPIAGLTDRRYYGLVHFRNKATTDTEIVLFKVTDNWQLFGMADPPNGAPFFFDPTPDVTPYFGDTHMLISVDPAPDAEHENGTTYQEAHPTVVKNKYCTDFKPDEPECEPEAWDGDTVGYEAAWRCVLGAGHGSASGRPIADAGPNQTVECQGEGGANVVLDGSGTRDYDCEPLLYEWAGPFDTASGRNPSVFCPLGINAFDLLVSDDWWQSLQATTLVTVEDTTPPSLLVTLTPTVLSPANHKMVRIDAVVNVADSCGGTPPQVVLTSITSSQPDNVDGDGDTANDIQDAQIETFDLSFFLRAERAGGDPNGRTYTITYMATDASGNRTQTIATVHVPHVQ